jgi:DNA-binding LacI/PurR family transcriptional regulator
MNENPITTYNSKATKIADQVADDIKRGKYATGVLLPAEDELARTYSVSRTTIRKSLAILIRKGRINKLPQRGALVPEASVLQPAVPVVKTQVQLSMAMIGCLTMDFSITRLIAGCKRSVGEHPVKFNVLISKTHEETLDILNRIEDYGINGVFISPVNDDRYYAVLARLLEKKFPIVSRTTLRDLPLSTTMSEDCQGAYDSVHYLIDKYHHPVYFLGEALGHELSPERREGYTTAMRDAGFSDEIETHTFRLDMYDFTPFWDIHEYWKPSFLAAKKFLPKMIFPASLFCLDDFAAQGIYRAAQEEGVRIGTDLMLVGCGDYPLAKLLKPALTTGHPPIEELGYESGKLLYRLMTGEGQAPMHVRLPMELIVRDSA